MDFIEVARIIKPHGLTGDVGVLMHWVRSEALLLAKRAQLLHSDGTVVERDIVRVRPLGRGYLVKFAGVDDCTAAETLRGAKVSVDRALLPPPEPGEAMLADLVGKPVLGPDSTVLGTVVEVASYPSVDALVIRLADGSRVEQPLVDDWVEPLEQGAVQVRLRSLDGLVG